MHDYAYLIMHMHLNTSLRMEEFFISHGMAQPKRLPFVTYVLRHINNVTFKCIVPTIKKAQH